MSVKLLKTNQSTKEEGPAGCRTLELLERLEDNEQEPEMKD